MTDSNTTLLLPTPRLHSTLAHNSLHAYLLELDVYKIFTPCNPSLTIVYFSRNDISTPHPCLTPTFIPDPVRLPAAGPRHSSKHFLGMLKRDQRRVAQRYPPAHFATLLQDLNPILQTLLVTLLTLLSRLTANSTSSGHTPPTLSPLFGPLIFGLGPATLAFHYTYTHYLRAVNAMEHLQLVFIRWQDATSAAVLGVPVRFKEWIKGYPAMLPFLQDPTSATAQKPQPRRGVRTVRVMSVRRNVRMYSPDIVRTAAAWAYRPESSASGPSKNSLLVSKEWSRIVPPTLKLPPHYSDAYRKRKDMPSNFHPETGVLSAPGLGAASSSSSYGSSLTNTSTNTSDNNNDYFGLGSNMRTGDDRFKSLTDLKWGEFESLGFSGLEDEKKLQFDLTESACTERSAKRESLTWTDFSSIGSTRTDAPLSATLQFSIPVAKIISAWRSHRVHRGRGRERVDRDPEGGLDHTDEVDDMVLRTSKESDYTNTNTNEGPETELVDHEELVQSSPITARLLAKNQRRMGYFDLHPDCRPGVQAHHALKEEDGGTGKDVRLAYEADSDENDKPLSSLGLGQTVQPLRRLPVPPVQTTPAPAPAPAPPVIKIEPAKLDAPKSVSTSGNGNGHPAVSVPMSKTAALIEMYRERERATSPKPYLSFVWDHAGHGDARSDPRCSSPALASCLLTLVAERRRGSSSPPGLICDANAESRVVA
ncbi:hypothetical protein C0995_001860 [Termitomyces sp. Mi166|nr:hypothetical protein C0995_001860 [Termitomyces sp. Mi166\